MIQQIWTTFLGSGKLLIVAPFLNQFVVARQEHIRHTMATEVGGACIYRSGKQVVLEGVGKSGGTVTDDTGNHAGDGIGNDHGCQFTAGKHVVTYAEVLGDVQFPYALVNALVVSAQQDDVVEH